MNRLPLLSFVAGAIACAGWAAPTVRLISNVPSPRPVGSVIGLSAQAKDTVRAPMVFRYSVSEDGGEFHVVRDFSDDPSFSWRPGLYEHEARVRVTVRNNKTKETGDAESPFRITSRISGSEPVITPTANPLVALFSAPACPEGSQFRVFFQPAGGEPHRTSLEPCRGSLSSNIYVAGMRSDAVYQMHAEVVSGDRVQAGPDLAFHTGLLDGDFPPVSISIPREAGTLGGEHILLSGLIGPDRFMATDLDGNIVWYLNGPEAFPTQVLPGGRFLLLTRKPGSIGDLLQAGVTPVRTGFQVLKEVDLAGNTLRETNIGRLEEQLEARGIPSSCKKGGQQCVSEFHHEAIRLPNGHTLAIAGYERMFPAGTQGSKEPVDILGDLVLDLDADFQLTWFWNAFDHMDLKRMPGDEKCRGTANDGCPSVILAPVATGWLHSNSLNYDRRDGNLLVSVPVQGWVVKVDYENGKGDGKVLWHLGSGGDFTVKSTDPYPWFSGEHDVGFDPAGSDMISLLDEGYERQKKSPNAHNRGQVWKIDEKARTATLLVSADLGVTSICCGAAKRLANGNLHALTGLVDPGPALFGRSVEVSPDGKLVYGLRIDGALAYRSWRVTDLYTPPDK